MIREKSFYRAFFAMAAILVLQNIITISVNLADNLMLGAFRESALSGAAAVNQVQFVFQQIVFAFGEATVIMATQYFGKRQMKPIPKLSALGMRFAVGTAVFLFFLTSLFPHAVLSVFTTDETIIAEGMNYLRIIRFTYPVFAVTQILLATLRSTGMVSISLIISLVALVTNCGINYTLIY